MTYMSFMPTLRRIGVMTTALLAIVALCACSGKHRHGDYDDEEDEDENTSALHIDDELLDSFDPNVPFEQTGRSRAFRIRPREDMVIRADAGAFERDVNIRVSDVSAEKMDELDRQLEGSGTTMLFAYDLDAGLPPDSVIPGKYTVSIDLEKHGIPEELYPYFMMYRVAGDGSLQPLNVRIKGHTATYMASQNSVTIAGLAFLFATIGIGAWVGYARFPAIMQTVRRMVDAGIWPSNWWKWDDAVFLRVTDSFGNFYVSYRYSMTEMGDKTREYVKKKNELIELEDAMRKVATERYDEQHPQRFRGWFDSKEEEEKRRIGREMEFYRLMANSDRVKELADDPVLQTPQSVNDIITATKLANRYCRSVQHMKPLSYEYVTYLTPAFDALNQEAFRHQVPLLDPIVVVNYENVVNNGTYDKKTYWKNLSTLAHETMHVYQMEYVVCSLFKNDRYLEATGALVEPHFTKWAIGLNIGVPVTDAFSSEAANIMGYTNRDSKHLLSSPLDKKCPSYQGVSLVQSECGYMLADLLQLLWDKKPNPRDTLDFAKMMNRYAVDKGLVKSLEDIFGIENDLAFVKYYEGFCQKYIGEIENKQYSYRMMDAGDHLVLPNVEHRPDHCIMRVKNLGEKGGQKGYPFMVNAFRILAKNQNSSGPRQRYNLFAVPSKAVKPGEVKFSFIKKDDFTADNMYFSSPAQGAPPPFVAAAVMTRPNSKDLVMGDDYYYDIVAFYQPTATPEVSGPSLDKRGLLVKPKCTPLAELKEKEYVTGLQIVMENNKTGSMQSFVVKVKDWKNEFVAPYNKLGITDTASVDVSLRSRWYYDSPQGQRYYSPATDIVNYRRQSDNVQQTVEQDTTQVVTGRETEAEEDQGAMYSPEFIDCDAYVESVVTWLTHDFGQQYSFSPNTYDPNERFIGHVTAKDGHFVITVPDCHLSKTSDDATITYDVPAFTVSGSYTVNPPENGKVKAVFDAFSVGVLSSPTFKYRYDCDNFLSTQEVEVSRRQGSEGIDRIVNGFYTWDGEKFGQIRVLAPAHLHNKENSTSKREEEETRSSGGTTVRIRRANPRWDTEEESYIIVIMELIKPE